MIKKAKLINQSDGDFVQFNITVEIIKNLFTKFIMTDYSVQLVPVNLYAYDLYSSIYGNLLNTMSTYPNIRNIQIKDDLKSALQEKLNKLQQAEKELKDVLANQVIKNQLLTNSYGYVNPYQVPDSSLPILLDKHNNLLRLSTAYNQRAINLANILSTMNKYIKGSVERQGKAERPLTINYH